ncbi:MucR family transcriptional regulator [Sphingomonas oleivorans]|uniref:MucR family transcriptional regulator n=1 Tax=Sphingomonas oleivorans TaxID=1735121 RepID=A0A2T5G0J5_9SPHN|nr:MucR family transcriptional regulator [Sphingomonas oleivorans]PTQ12653.1 MucR family transcriptional regulator [Sphingomonas oleivorans]
MQITISREAIVSDSNDDIIQLVADIVSAHVSNNNVSVSDVPTLIRSVHGALIALGAPAAESVVEKPEPAVSIRASVKPDYIVDLFTGKKLKMLKRHLATHHNMTPAEYRAYWNLPSDYPMVAPNYAAQRKELAHKIGLGRKPKAAPEPAKPAPKARASRKAAKAPEPAEA